MAALSDLLGEDFAGEAPDIKEMLGKYPKLEKLGSLVCELVGSTVPEETARVIEGAIRHFGSACLAASGEKNAGRAKLEREFEDAVSQERVRYVELEDRFHEVLGRWKVGEAVREGLEAQLEKANEEYAAVVGELKKMKEKMAKKRDQWNASVTERYQLRAELEQRTAELKQARLRLEMEAEKRKKQKKSHPVSVSREEMRLHVENGKLASAIKELTEKVQEMQNERQKMQEKMDAEAEKYASRVQKLERGIEQEKKENESLKVQVSERVKEVEELAVAKARAEKKLSEIMSVVVAIQNQIEDKPPISILPERVAKLTDQGPAHEEIRRLKALVNGYATFVVQLLENGRCDLSLLDGLQKLPDWMKRSVEGRIGQCRKFVYENGVTDAIPLFDAALGQPQSTAVLLRSMEKCDEAYSLLSTFTSIAGRLVSRINDDNEKVAKIGEILHLDEARKTKLLSSILKYHEENGQIIDQLVLFLIKKGETDVTTSNVLPLVNSYVVSADQALTALETNLREFAKKGSPIAGIPKQVRQQVTSMAKAIRDMQSQLKTAEATETELQETKAQLLEMASKFKQSEQRNDSLTAKLQEKDEHILSLSDQMEQLIDTKAETERQLDATTASKQELEATCDLLKTERDRLEKALSDKAASFEKRLESIVECEKHRHEEEIRRLTDRSSTQQELVLTKLKDKSRKLGEAKKTISELQQCITANQKKFQSTVSTLQEQNELLMKQHQKKRDNLTPEDRQLLKTANTQRREMLSKISELSNSRSTLAISIEDDFIGELGRILESCFRSSGEWTEKRVKKAVKLLANRVLALESPHKYVNF